MIITKVAGSQSPMVHAYYYARPYETAPMLWLLRCCTGGHLPKVNVNVRSHKWNWLPGSMGGLIPQRKNILHALIIGLVHVSFHISHIPERLFSLTAKIDPDANDFPRIYPQNSQWCLPATCFTSEPMVKNCPPFLEYMPIPFSPCISTV